MGKKAVDPQREAIRNKLEVIFKVYLEEINATAGAEQLGVSRKTFYEYHDALLDAAIRALTPGEPGRPKLPEPVVKLRQSEAENARLREDLAETRAISALQSEVIAIRDRQLAERKKKRG